jgi:hypothetical protein
LQLAAGVWLGINRLIFPVTTVCDRLPGSTTTTTTTTKNIKIRPEEQALTRRKKKKKKKLARRRKIAIILALYTPPYLLKTAVRISIRTGEILNVHPRPSAEFTVPLVTGSAAAAAAVFLVVLGGIVSDSCCTDGALVL